MTHIDLNQIVNWRREFHRYPESGWTEFVTTAKIVKTLREMGFCVKLGPDIINREFILGRDEDDVAHALKEAETLIDAELLTQMDGLSGCAAILETGKPGPVFAFRFDIDCVQVQESNASEHRPHAEGFASTRPGLMHACGHDGHAAIGLGVANWLMKNQAQLKGTYKLIFQPAEEGVRGAKPITESGILDDVDYFLALHLGAGAKENEVLLDIKGMQCSTKIDFTFQGKSAHAGADPHQGNNALAGACNAAMLMLAAPRHGEGSTRVNVGTIRAGEGRNVIPASGQLQIEVRGANQTITTFLEDYVTRCAESSALLYGLTYQKRLMGEAIDITNSPEMITLLTEVVETIPTIRINNDSCLGGSEDASIMIRRVQDRGGLAAYILVGSDLPGGHHQTRFDFNEQAMETGVRIMTSTVTSILQKNM